MARQKKVDGEENPTSGETELSLLRKELAALRVQVASQKVDPYEEIRKASVRAQKGNEPITIRPFTDHKKVALYHTNGFHVGKCIPPLHPGLLPYTFYVFKEKGIILSTVKPTDAQIAEYKETSEYKAIAEQQKKIKPNRNKVQTPEETQRIIAGFAKLLGVKPEDAIQLLPQEAVIK
jgi:hypothetical protein